MKSIAILLLFFVAGFAGGYAYSSHFSASSYQHEREAAMRFNSEMAVAFALMNIRFAESGNNQDAIQANCRIARSSIGLVDPGFYEDPQKQKEIADLASRAKRTISALESSGKCLGGSPARANNSFKPKPLRGSA